MEIENKENTVGKYFGIIIVLSVITAISSLVASDYIKSKYETKFNQRKAEWAQFEKEKQIALDKDIKEKERQVAILEKPKELTAEEQKQADIEWAKKKAESEKKFAEEDARIKALENKVAESYAEDLKKYGEVKRGWFNGVDPLQAMRDEVTRRDREKMKQ